MAKELDAQTKEFNFEDALFRALKIPGAHINREIFLRSAFANKFSEETIEEAIAETPAKAGITIEEISPIADASIRFETTKVTALSAAAGIPGGIALAGTIPADMAQYLGHALRIIQKLAYLYGWQDFFADDSDKIDDGTKNMLTLFVGVMFGAVGAEAGIAQVAKMIAANVEKNLAKKALTKGAIYPIVKNVAKLLGVNMTKQIFAKGVSKAIPVVGAVLSGGLTLAMYVPMSLKLKGYLEKLELADPNFDPTQIEIDLESEIVVEAEDVNDVESLPESDDGMFEELTGEGKKEKIILPDYYGKLNKAVPKELPKGAFGKGVSTENALCLAFAWPVTAKESMPFDDNERIISELHEETDGSMGIIEVGNGVTNAGRPYVYNITKRDGNYDTDIPFADVDYIMNMNVAFDDAIWFVNSDFHEEGVTGMRDAMVLSMLQNEGELEAGSMDGWTQDPYDPDFKLGFLMNKSENAEYDAMFPDHPLSMARNLVSELIELN